jgi:hypothetical protein
MAASCRSCCVSCWLLNLSPTRLARADAKRPDPARVSAFFLECINALFGKQNWVSLVHVIAIDLIIWQKQKYRRRFALSSSDLLKAAPQLKLRSDNRISAGPKTTIYGLYFLSLVEFWLDFFGSRYNRRVPSGIMTDIALSASIEITFELPYFPESNFTTPSGMLRHCPSHDFEKYRLISL